MSTTAPPPPQSQPQNAPASSPEPPIKSKRPWFKKKRFIIPIALFLFFAFVGSLSDDPAPAGTAAPATVEQDEAVTEDTESAEERAAREAEEAEAERVEQEREAAAAEAERVKKEEEAAAAEAERVKQEEEAAAEAARIGSVSQQNAYESALSYLDFSAFSRAGLLEQLTSEYGEGFPVADAEFAIARLEAEGGVDWNAEAAESAKSYLEYSSFSRQGLIEQLTSEYGEGFTLEQAEYGVSTTGL